MARSKRLQRFSQEIEVMLDRSMSPEARSRLLAGRARQALAESQRINAEALGEIPPHRSFVDGRPSTALESVNPDNGTIVFRFELGNQAVEYVYELLLQQAPAVSGRYRDSIVIFADGDKVETIDPMRRANEWVFVPGVAYARKIETADGVFEGVAAMATARFGNIAFIRFGYQDLRDPGSHLAEWASSRDSSRRASRQERGKMLRQPAITITMR